VGTVSDRAYLLATTDLAPESVQVVDPLLPTTGAMIANLYQTL
jgi:hypothetical protein